MLNILTILDFCDGKMVGVWDLDCITEIFRAGEGRYDLPKNKELWQNNKSVFN